MTHDLDSLDSPPASVAPLADLARLQLGEMSDVQEARGLNQTLDAFARTEPRRQGFRILRAWPAWGAALTVVLVAGWFAGARVLGGKPLGYTISQGEVQAGGYFRSGEQASTIRFSDGTNLALAAGSRGRIASVDAHGARVILDEGEARVHVVHVPRAHWLFDAGPFLVHVRGTEFTLTWRGEEGRLDLRMHDGAVSVTGPVSDQAIALRAGQWMTVRLASREVFVRDLEQAHEPDIARDQPTVAPKEMAPPIVTSGITTDRPSSRLSTKVERESAPPAATNASRSRRTAVLSTVQLQPGSVDEGWAPARAEGDWDRILGMATRRGLDRTLTERSSEDLALLADAAHYRQRDDIAEKALLAQRRRFPGSTRAKDAAFLLGRIVEGRPDGAGEALAWYDRHLDEAPTGAYAPEALGRKMAVVAKLRGEIAARPIAEEYLRRYPSGTYARAARVTIDKH